MEKLLRRKHSQVLSALAELEVRLDELSMLASEAYGEDLTANLCNGAEIEFRTSDDPDGLHSVSIRLEDVLSKINARKEG